MYNKETIKGTPHVCFDGKNVTGSIDFRGGWRSDEMEGVRRRVIQEMQNPMVIHDEVKFRICYHPTKATVVDLSMQYTISDFCSTLCSDVGGRITAGERVGKKNYISFLKPNCLCYK